MVIPECLRGQARQPMDGASPTDGAAFSARHRDRQGSVPAPEKDVAAPSRRCAVLRHRIRQLWAAIAQQRTHDLRVRRFFSAQNLEKTRKIWYKNSMHRTVLQNPNSVLRQKVERVSDFKDPQLPALFQDMRETMVAEDGIGIAAPQVGVSLAIFLIAHELVSTVRTLRNPCTLFHPMHPHIFINPRILSYSKEKQTDDEEEGCLSVRGVFASVSRAQSVVLEAQNEKGEKFRIRAESLLARVFQHETDHLNGMLFIDRLHE